MVVGNVGTYNSPCVVLGQNRYWWKFILSSVITPFVLAFLVLLARFFVWIHYRALRRTHLDTETNLGFIHSMRKIHKEIEVPWMNAIRDAADLVVSPRYTSGHVLIVAAFVISMCSLFLYYNTVSYYISDVEMCQPWLNNVGQQVDFAFNMFFLVYFILRFLAAADKIKMIFSLYSIVDYFTVPPAFVGLALDRDWVGLKFLRVIYLRQLARILADMDIIVSTAHIKLLQLGLSWIALLLAAGGFFHLVENSGDPFISTFDGQRINYWNFCYFAFGTMATIGSADTNVKTVLGKLGNVVLMLIVLAVIGLAIPDIVNMLGAKRKYSGEHRRILNEKHIVVCGDVSFGTIYGLFQEFFHPDRNVHGIKIVCLGLPEPGLEYARFIKKNTYKLGYLQGSFLVAEDLYRARLHEADACVIMADKGTPNANAEDSNNIMCVVAIKNFNPQLRVIVQLLQYRSKTYLTSIPNWNPAIGDDVICLPEIKMGLLAQSCASPGFSTLMANIFAARSAEPKSSWPEWLQNYCTGAGIEMYTERLSDSLANCGFLELVETCYAKLNLIVFAVSEGPTNGEFFSQSFQLNPRTTYKIKVGSYAACFADSAKDASRNKVLRSGA